MTQLETTLRKARRRMTLDCWISHVTVAAAVGAGAFGAVALVARLFGWQVPLGIAAVAVAVAAVIVATTWSVATRVDLATAAAVLDDAAGLRERLSSGYYCQIGEDVFERAVRVDAERTSAGVSPRAHLRLHRPRHLGTAAVAFLLSAGTMLVPPGVLVQTDAKPREDALELERTTALIQRQAEQIRAVAKTNAEFKRIAEEMDKLAAKPEGELDRPADLRNQALKKLDRMQDALQKQRRGDRFEQVREFSKMLRRLEVPQPAESPTTRLAEALAAGDFKAAREQLQRMQQQLSEQAKTQDVAKLQAMQKQLESLAKQLERLADDEKLAEKLAQAGLKKEDVERLMKNVTAEDLEKLKQQLEKQGMSQKAIEQLAKQLQQQSGAGQMAQQLAQALAQAGAAAGAGQAGKASDGLTNAAGQLSEMEMLEQEMNQIDSMIAGMQDARNQIATPCSQCQGTGQCGGRPCSACAGAGGGSMGGMGAKQGHGRGGIAAEESTPTAFVKQRQKVPTVRGAITGQYLVDGEQYEGEVSPAVAELIGASERRAADAIEARRIPRRYHSFIKAYFSDLRKELRPADGAAVETEEKTTDAPSETEAPSDSPGTSEPDASANSEDARDDD